MESITASGLRFAAFLAGVVILSTAVSQPAGMGSEADGQSHEAAYLSQIKLRSVVALPFGELFSLHDPENERAFWIEPGEVRHGITAVAYDPERRTLKIRFGEAERTVGLSHARIRDARTASNDEIEDVRRRWEERTEERQRFQERWDAALKEHEELREIVDHAQDIFSELQELRDALDDTETETGDRPHLELRQRMIGEEYRLLEHYTVEMVATLPAFETEDVETVELLTHLVRDAWPEVNEAP